jgi:hypothetical protein
LPSALACWPDHSVTPVISTKPAKALANKEERLFEPAVVED